MRGKSVTILCSGLLVFFFLGLIVGAGAQVESFYRGKTVTIVVGYNPGDAHDLWARAYARGDVKVTGDRAVISLLGNVIQRRRARV